MRKASLAIRAEKLSQFVDYFKLIANDMDVQYLQMCDARKHLFDLDSSEEHGCNVDLEAGVLDGSIDWMSDQGVSDGEDDTDSDED